MLTCVVQTNLKSNACARTSATLQLVYSTPPSELVPCPGWSATTIKNWTNCELLLGCAYRWQLQDASEPSSLARRVGVTHTTVALVRGEPSSRVNPSAHHHPRLLPVEMGFFGQPSAKSSGFLLVPTVGTAVKAFVTFSSDNNLEVHAATA